MAPISKVYTLFFPFHLKQNFKTGQVGLRFFSPRPLSESFFLPIVCSLGDLISKASPLQYHAMPWNIHYLFLALFPQQNLPALCLISSADGFIQCDSDC